MAEAADVKKAAGNGIDAPAPAPAPSSKKDYKGFVAGVFSGIAKLSGEFEACLTRKFGINRCWESALTLSMFSWPPVRLDHLPIIWISYNNGCF